MRTTITLEDDVAAEIERLRRQHGGGLSEIVNLLLRRAILGSPVDRQYVHRSADLGLRLDVTNVAEVLETLDDEA